MSDERIDIEIQDKVSPGISSKILAIAAASRDADSAVSKLKAQLATLNNGALAQLQQATAQATLAVNQNAMANQRLATELQRTAQATANAQAAQARANAAQTQGATAAQQLATATARTATAQQQTANAAQRLTTEQQRTAVQTANVAAASDRAALANLRLQQAQQRAAQAASQVDSTMRGVITRLAALVGGFLSVKSIISGADEYQALANKLQIVSDSSAQVAELQGRLFDIANRTRASVEATTTSFARFDNALIGLGKSQEDSLRLTETINKLLKIGGATAQESAGAMIQLSQAFNSGVLQGDEFRSVAENMPKAVRTAIAETLKINESALKKAASEGKITADVLFNAFKKLDEFADSKFAKTVPTIAEGLVVLKNTFIQASGEMDKNLGIVSSLVEFLNGLGNIISQVGEAFNAFGKEQDNVASGSAILKGLLEAVLVVLQTIIVITSDVIYVFKMTGNEIGAIAAQLAALANLDFAGFEAISKAVKEDAIKARKELDDFQARVMAVTTNPVKREAPATGAASTLRKAGPRTISTPPDKGIEKRAMAMSKINSELDKELRGLYLLKPEREIQSKLDQIEINLASKKIKLTNQERDSLREKIKAIEDNKAVQQAFDQIYESAIAPARDYNAQLTAGAKLLSMGAISQEQYSRAVVMAAEAYKNAIDPMYQINRELEQQAEILGKIGPQQEIAQQMQQYQNELLQKGIVLNEQERASLQSKLEVLQQQKGVSQELNKIYSETQGKQVSLQQQTQALNQAYANGLINLDNYSLRLVKLGIDQANLKLQMQDGSFTDVMISGLGQIVSQYEGVMSGLSGAFGNFFQSFTDGFANSVGHAIVYSDNLNEALSNVAKEAVAGLISALVKLGIQYAVNAVLGNTIAATALTTQTAASVAAAAVTATAWATPAALVSLASFGANSVPAMAGIAATEALTEGMALATVAGFESGGYTGNVGTSEIAGVVHGQEFVVNAAATARNRDTLEAMNRGASGVALNSASAGTGSASGGINVSIQNFGTSKDFEVQQISESDVRIIARDEAKRIVKQDAPGVVASDIGNPNSRVSKSLSNNTSVQRRR